MHHQLALVTGATSGIGKAACQLFAQKGVNLIISGRDSQKLLLLQQDLSKLVKVQAVQADLSQAVGRQQLIEILHSQLPDLVINNAGFGFYGGILTYSTEEQVGMLEVNGRAVLELTLEAARALISAGKKGVVLNVASSAAFQVLPNMAVYSASKSFVKQFSQAFDFEVRNKGVRILTLCPGMVATDFQERAGGMHLDQQETGVMTADFVAQQMWKQIQLLNPLMIIDWKYRLLTFLSLFLPTSWIAKRVERTIAQRIKPKNLIKVKE